MQVGGVANIDEFRLGVVVTNNADATVQVQDLRMEPSLFDVLPTGVVVRVLGGSSMQVDLHLQARCPVPTAAGVRIVVPVVAASGRRHPVTVDVEPTLLADLARRACGEIPPFAAAVISVRDVTSSRYGVAFSLSLGNRSTGDLRLLDVASVGLAIAVRGGAPVSVPRNGRVTLRLRAELPVCARLPGDPAVGTRYGALQLVLLDGNGQTQVAPYRPDPAGQLYQALIALRSRICPTRSVTVRVPGPTPGR